MARSATEISNAYDTAILISGDADLVPAVEGVKDIGKHVENAFVYTGHSRHLRQTCDRFILLDEAMLEQCWLGTQDDKAPNLPHNFPTNAAPNLFNLFS